MCSDFLIPVRTMHDEPGSVLIEINRRPDIIPAIYIAADMHDLYAVI